MRLADRLGPFSEFPEPPWLSTSIRHADKVAETRGIGYTKLAWAIASGSDGASASGSFRWPGRHCCGWH
jgi:hypothetical protein